MMNPRHVVWPTPAPPVSTALWTQESWMAFEDRYRPAGYTGDRFDQVAWDRYHKARMNESAERERLHWHASILRSQGQEAADRWLALNREANA